MSNKEKISIGVTGANGFLGSFLVKKLKKEGYSVHCFCGDLLKITDLQDFFINKNISTMIHLAGKFSSSSEELIKSNLITTSNLLNSIPKSNFKKIIFSSTAAVYGNSKTMSDENDSPSPIDDYSFSKYAAEEYIKMFSRKYDKQYVILRFSSIYGHGNDKGVVFTLINGAKKSKITINGSGNQIRNFVEVEEAVEAIIKSIDLESSQIVNVGNSLNVSINDMVEELKKYANFEIKYENANNCLVNMSINTRKSEEILGIEYKKNLYLYLKENFSNE